MNGAIPLLNRLLMLIKQACANAVYIQMVEIQIRYYSKRCQSWCSSGQLCQFGRRQKIMVSTPFPRLRSIPSCRPGNVTAVGKNFRFREAMAIAVHIDMGVAGIGTRKIGAVMHAARFMRRRIGMAQPRGFAHLSSAHPFSCRQERG